MLLDIQGLEDQKVVLESARTLLNNDSHWKKWPIDILFSENIFKLKSIERTGSGTQRSSATLSNETDAGKEDIEILNRKIKESDNIIKRYTNEAKKKRRDVEESKANLDENMERWNILHIQIKQLKEYVNDKIQQVYTKIGSEIMQKSLLTIEMFNLV